MVKDWENSEL
jgi:hypothetical protein